MAELLIRVVDKINEDFYLNLQCTKRGDVIVVVEDGHQWGEEEAIQSTLENYARSFVRK